MNPIEKMAAQFLLKELTTNPKLAGNFLLHVLEQTKLDPNLQADLVALAEQIIPLLLQNVKIG